MCLFVYIILSFRRRILTYITRKYVDLSIDHSHISNFDSIIIHFKGVISLIALARQGTILPVVREISL